MRRFLAFLAFSAAILLGGCVFAPVVVETVTIPPAALAAMAP